MIYDYIIIAVINVIIVNIVLIHLSIVYEITISSLFVGACKIQGERYFDENGLERVRITEFKMKISVGKGWMRLDNLFNGEEVLGNVVNTAINNNFDLFMREFLPLIEMALSDAFKDIAENIVQQFSFAQLFPGAK